MRGDFKASDPAYQTSGEVIPGAGPLANMIAQLVLTQLFGTITDPRNPGLAGGMGMFRPSDVYMRHIDTQARRETQYLSSQNQISQEISRLVESEKSRLQTIGEMPMTATQEVAYARQVESQARQTVSQEQAKKAKTDVEIISRVFENIARGSRTPDELANPAIVEEIKKESYDRAVNTRALFSNPFVASIAETGVRMAERQGIQVSNLLPDYFLGGSVYDSMRMTAGYRGVSGAAARDAVEALSAATINDQGMNYQFTSGLSALEVGDTLKAFSSRGLMPSELLGGMADTGGADYTARKTKLVGELDQMNEAVAALKDLFGPGKSIDELLNSLDEMTQGGLQSMSRAKIEKIANETREIAHITGRTPEQVAGLVTMGAQAAVQSGLQGEAGTQLMLDTLRNVSAGEVVRGGQTYYGAQSLEERAAMRQNEGIRALNSSQGVALGAFTSTIRAAAAGAGVEGYGNMRTSELIDSLISKNPENASPEQLNRMRSLSESFKRVEQGRGSTDDLRAVTAGIEPLMNIMTPAVGEVYRIQARRANQFRPVNVEQEALAQLDTLRQAQVGEIERYLVDATAASTTATDEQRLNAIQLLRRSGVDNAEDAVKTLQEASQRGENIGDLGTRENIVPFFTAIQNTFGERNGTGIFAGYGSNFRSFMYENSDRAVAVSTEQQKLGEAMTGINKKLRERGLGVGSVFDRLVNDALVDPDVDLKKSLSERVLGKFSEEDLKLFEPVIQYQNTMKNLDQQLKEDKITPKEYAERQVEALDTLEKTMDDMGISGKDIQDAVSRAGGLVTGDPALDTLNAIESNTAKMAESFSSSKDTASTKLDTKSVAASNDMDPVKATGGDIRLDSDSRGPRMGSTASLLAQETGYVERFLRDKLFGGLNQTEVASVLSSRGSIT